VRQDPFRLSKFMALLLRHKGPEHGLEFDRDGFTAVAKLAEAIAADRMFADVTRDDVERIVRSDAKGRYEIAGDRIRARYGHSPAVRVDYPAVKPPPRLFHGTSRGAVGRILREGIMPAGRLYVHLSANPESAFQVGRRHDPRPVILEIDAESAERAGIAFHRATQEIYLAREIPPRFVRHAR
jgi:putative RNA 2'-phosphotransferase